MAANDEETYECPADGCERTFDSARGKGVHVSRIHDMDQIVKDTIRDLADELGRTPTQREMNEHGSMSDDTVKRCFGTWNGALREAGVEINEEVEISDEDILSAIRDLAGELGRTPTQQEMREHGSVSPEAAENHFDTWNGALREAGLEINMEKNISDEDVLSAIRKIADELGRAPTFVEMNERGSLSPATVGRHFETWNKALQEAGLDVNKVYEYSKEHVLTSIRDVADDLGRAPTAKEMNNRGNVSTNAVGRHFGSWNDALRAAGLEPNQTYNGSSSGVIYYGTNWLQQRTHVVSRDKSICRTCGTSSTEIDHTSIHVHHITPAREFGAHKDDVDTNYEEMNAPSNLICLCPSCHRTLEGKFQDADPDEFAELGREYLGIDVEAEIDTTQDTTDGSVQTELPTASD